MFKIQLNSKYFAFITFDGLVVEYFNEDNERSSRIHVKMIKSIEMTKDKKGTSYLKLATKKINLTQDLDEGVVDEVRKMVADVQKAMTD